MADFKTILVDRTLPLEIRIDAAKKLSLEFEHWELGRIFVSVFDSEDEDPVLRTVTLAILAFQNPAASVEILVRPFENSHVRRAAIEILNKLVPVTGPDEGLLTTELSALRGTITEREMEALLLSDPSNESLSATINYLRATDNEEARSRRTITFAQRWGRDPRVLAFLIEELQQLNENRRRGAVFALCMLGELQPALEAASDPSSVVRLTLASRLGYYREEAGIEALTRLLADSNPEVSNEARTALRLLNRLAMPQSIEQPPRATAWGQLLTEISRVQLADRKFAAFIPDNKIAAGWLGEPGATEADIASAEERLGIRFPPSYRAFLAETNGFDHIGPFIYRLYGAAEIDWFRVRNQDWIDAYQIGDDISAEEHLANPYDCVRFRTAYLSSCLQVSDEGDSAVVLLNPEVVNDEGEWETWLFANWHPGADRYPSFLAYVESELQSIKSLRAARDQRQGKATKG